MPRKPSNPRTVSAAELAAILGVGAPSFEADVRGATHHNGRVREGDAFFALPGARGHGMDYADAALAAGASLVVSDRPHPRGIVVDNPGEALLTLGRWARARLGVPVVGITGSAGKTTARALVKAVLAGESNHGNLNTPHAIAGRLVQAWSDQTGAPLVLEVGIDRPGEMDVLADLVRPDAALLTAIAASHLDALGDLEGVAREKQKLLARADFRAVAWDAFEHLNPTLKSASSRYGLGRPGTVRAQAAGSALEPELEVLEPAALRVPLPGVGRGLAESAVGALVIAQHLGLDVTTAADRLQQTELEPGRLTVRRAAPNRLVLDDSYNSNPASAAASLDLLWQVDRPKIALLGEMLEMGAEREARHEALGRATVGLDDVWFVGASADAFLRGNHEANVTDLSGLLRVLSDLPEDAAILVKASRSIRFDRVTAALLGEEARA